MTKNKQSTSGKLKVTQIASTFGRIPSHVQSVKGLGLHRIRDSVVIEDTLENRGMINKAHYLLKVEDAQ